ncbi:MAG: FecCD family ABC transporter permease [Hyphomicrobiales bacterium]
MSSVALAKPACRRTGSYPALLFGLFLLALTGSLLGLLDGDVEIGAARLLAAFTGDRTPSAEITRTILLEIRLPRVLMAVLVGASLGGAGAVLQGYLRNPLAEPGLIGVSAGASCGAAATIVAGAPAFSMLALPVAGLAGSLAAVLIVMWLNRECATSTGLILSGIAVTSFFGALTALTVNLSPNPYAAVEIIFWMFGSLTDRSLEHFLLSAALAVPGIVILLRTGRALDALALGEEAAINLGVDLRRLWLQTLAGTALAVGAVTSITGTIGFVGLMVPHILRPMVSHRPSRLLPASMIGGAALVLFADLFARNAPTGSELNLGVVTALVGAPFFFLLVLRNRRGDTSWV